MNIEMFIRGSREFRHEWGVQVNGFDNVFYFMFIFFPRLSLQSRGRGPIPVLIRGAFGKFLAWSFISVTDL